MSRITNFEISEKKSVATQYEPRHLLFNVVVDEGEDENIIVAKYVRKLQWFLHKPEREAEYNKWVAAFARNAEMDEKQIATGKAFIAKYETALAEIEGV